jgi:sugar/nucleoside kinase (ribokinase family)
MSLLTIGTVALDTVYTPFGTAERVIGGAATYACWAASYFTKKQRLVSIIGDDFPKKEIDALAKRGVDMDGLDIVEGKKSFFWEGRYNEDMNTRSTITTDLNVLADFDPILPKKYLDSNYLMLGNLTPEIQLSIINQMPNRPQLVAMDTMNFWIDVAKDSLLKVIEKIDVLTINDQEARQLTGVYSLAKAAKMILAMGPKYLIIKKGEHGALLFHKDEVFFAPGLPLTEVFDPTGAGDSFAGGFMGYMAMTEEDSFENMKRAVIYGSVMASFCVQEFSIKKLKHLTKRDLASQLKKFIRIVNFSVI